MPTTLKCTRCGTAAAVPGTPAEAGWTRASLDTPRGWKYLCFCPAESAVAIMGAIKSALDAKRGE